MKYYLVLCVVLVLIGFSVQGVAGDTMPIDLSITLDNDMLIASGEDQANITVLVVNRTTGFSESNLPVRFTLNDSDLGTLSISQVNTDSNGYANTVFAAKDATGTAKISVMVDYHGTDLGPWERTAYIIGYPDEITISGSVDWLVAGQTSTSSLITVQAFNQSRPIPNLRVSFTEPWIGTINVLNGRTDSEGKATTRFTPSTESGVAYVQAVVYFLDEEIQKMHEQKIDHAAPVASSIWHNAPSQILVGDNTTITVAYFDQYDNPIDNRRNPEYLNLWVNSVSTPSPNPPLETPAGLWNGTKYVHDLTVELDELGVASFDMQADTQIGLNKITVDPQFDGASKTIDIEGVAGIPVRIEYDISTHAPPDPYPNIPADGQSVFTILCTLKDESNNPVGNSYFWMNTTLGERTKLKTNSSGMVKTTYGPKIRTDIIDLTMTAVDPMPGGSFASNAVTVEITSLEPTQMSLTANPQFVPSWDVPGENTASIMAVVMDRYGNPVKNETVVLQINPNWEDEYETENRPRWRDYEGLTIELITEEPDEDSVDAYALAEFRPGYYEGYGYPQEQDSCTITAEWVGDSPQSVTINWTNVPFLSISTDVSPAVAAWDEDITVNIKVIGNGYALMPPPIDAVLVIDTSLSMTMYSMGDGTRLDAAKVAAKNFVGNMDVSAGRDRIGLVSFSNEALVNQPLTDDKDLINSSIDSLDSISYTNVRDGYYKGIKHLKEYGRPNALKAVILMTDGDWNYDGNPLAVGIGFPDSDPYPWSYMASHDQCTIKDSSGYWAPSYKVNGYEWYSDLPDPKGTLSTQKYWRRTTYGSYLVGDVCIDGQNTNQNMSVYATSGDEDHQVKIYSLGFAEDLNDRVEADLNTLSDATNGWYQWAGDEEELDTLYTKIAGELKEEAGIGIQMDLPFDDVKVATNTSSWTIEGKEIFDYVPYTDERKYWFTNSTDIYHYPDRDDTVNWDAGEILFDIGTMKLNQAWESTFHLKVLNTTWNVGRITLFDQDDTIQFSDGTNWFTLSLPTTFITCLGGQSETQIATEEAGYDITSITNESTMITVTFNRLFIVNGTPQDEWYRTWYENYFIDIPGYRSKTKIGSRVIPPTVPKTGAYTFDLGPYLPPGQSSVDFNFYVEGTDKTIDAVNRKRSNLRMDPGKIYILLK